MFYVLIGNEIAIGERAVLSDLYPGAEIFELPADYYEHQYVVKDGQLVIDESAEKARKIEELDAEYMRQKALLVEQYTDDTLHDDAEAMAADKEEMAALDAWYDEQYQLLQKEAE